MARWDEILSLPVQNPPSLEFSSDDLVWSKVEGWRDKLDRVALIPFARVDDFVRGESSNKDCPTRFHVEARRRRSTNSSYKPKVDGILEYILYWCSFGPDDHRKGGVVRPSRNTYIPKKKNAGRPNTKRGCTCHFIVKRLIAEPSVALIIYNDEKHVDKNGLPCHGPQDEKAAGTRAMYAPYISEDLRLRVLSLLYVGVSVETIMQRHNESVERQGGPCNRDDLLTHRYVRRQERSIRRATYELDPDDAVSINMWVESHQSHVFFYEDFSENDPFTLGIQTEWQLQQMIRFGNRSLLVSDSRFGTNKLKYPLHSLVVFNSDNKAIPVAWIITPKFASTEAHRWMRALYNRIRTKDPTWKLGGFIVDDPSADIFAIRDVFQCSVLISLWRLRRAWHKNLVKRCPDTETRAQIFGRLGDAVDAICRKQGTIDLFEGCMEDFIDVFNFMDYFKAVWYPKIGTWIAALQTLPLASQETSAAIEFYHNQLKLRLLNEKDTGVYQRTDWLVDKLGTKVHSYFWLDEYSGKDDFSRYWKDEWESGLTSWRKALKIPDSSVIIEVKHAKVTDQLDGEKVYVVRNPGSQFGICDCRWAEMGYLCEHVLKVISFCRKKESIVPSISFFQYKQALIDLLHCSSHDSLIRDYAVSLAVHVESQLNSLIDLASRQKPLDSFEKQTANTTELQIGGTSSNSDEDRANENGRLDGQDANSCEMMSSSDKSSKLKQTEEDASGGTVNDLGQNGSDGLVSNDNVVSSDGIASNEERVVTKSDSDNGNNPPLKDDVLTGQDGVKEVISEQTHQNSICGNETEQSVSSVKADAISLPEKASPTMFAHTESTAIETVEIPGVVKDSKMELESLNQNATQTSDNDAFPSTVNSDNKNHAAESCEMISSGDKHSLARCKLKRAAEDENFEDKELIMTKRLKRDELGSQPEVADGCSDAVGKKIAREIGDNDQTSKISEGHETEARTGGEGSLG